MIKALLWLVLIIGVFIVSYVLNKRTPKPAGCEFDESACAGCQMVSCGHYKGEQS